jgi:hypothetical protein
MDAANVRSVEVIAHFRAAMIGFEHAATDAIGQVQMEIHRVLEWIEHDRVAYWQDQVRRGWDRIAEARANLER